MNKISMIGIPKTIYTDIVSMPDPMLLGMTIHYYNHSDVGLYLQIVSVGTNWSGSTVNLGLISSGGDGYINLDNFASRTKPVNALTETLTATLKGYSDAGYTTLVYSFSRDITTVFIKSDDGTWTTDNSDNFDDGTVDDWSLYWVGSGGTGTIGIASDFVLSSAYSLRTRSEGIGYWDTALGMEKVFTTSAPNSTVYAIINVRVGFLTGYNLRFGKLIVDYVSGGTTTLITLGDPTINMNILNSDHIPVSKWLRIIVPLPSNTTLTLRVYVSRRALGSDGPPYNTRYAYVWLDDFKIISK